MKILSKKLEKMLTESPSHKALYEHAKNFDDYTASVAKYLGTLEERVKTLEGQVGVLASTTRSLMETCTQLVRGHMHNRKAIEDILGFITSTDDLPMPLEQDEMLHADRDAEPNLTPEEIAAYKKTLN